MKNHCIAAVSGALWLSSNAFGAIVVELKQNNSPVLLSEERMAPELSWAITSGSRYIGSTVSGGRVYDSVQQGSETALFNKFKTDEAFANVRPIERPTTWANRLVVLFKNDAGSAAAFTNAFALKTFEGLEIVGSVPALQGLVLAHSKGFGPGELTPLRDNQQLRRIEVDYDYYLFASGNTPNDSDYAGKQWALRNIHATHAWGSVTESSALVAVIDTGIDFTHPDLIANIWQNPNEQPNNGLDEDRNGYIDDVHGYNFVKTGSPPLDQNSHGSHVAGIIGAVGNNGKGVTGVNWRVRMMAVQVFSSDGFPVKGSEIANAITYAANNGARVLNNSWGGSEYTRVVRDAIEYVQKKGGLFIAAAGNAGSDVDKPGSPNYPSGYDLDNIISVGNLTEEGRPSYDSNFGATKVHLFAPGDRIYSTVPGGRYDIMSGTSMAAPFVSGACALIWSHPVYVNKDWRAVKEALLSHVRKIDTLKGKCSTEGTLDLAFLGEPELQAPVVWVERTGVLVRGPSLGSDAPTGAYLLPDSGEESQKVWLDFGGLKANLEKAIELNQKRIKVRGELVITNKPSGLMRILKVEKTSVE